jgi:hypothetical protein
MSAPKRTPRVLPDHPSEEHLRKQAKRLALDEALGLAAAQRRLAADYGMANWAELMRRVDAAQPLSPLAAAAKAGDLATVRRLLREGASPDGAPGDRGKPLWQACASDAPDSLPLHMAALHEDLPMMALLVARGARTDIPDKLWGSTPLGWATHENKARAKEWLEKNIPPHLDGQE